MMLLAAPSDMELAPLRSLLRQQGYRIKGKKRPCAYGTLTFFEKNQKDNDSFHRGWPEAALLITGIGKVRSAISTISAFEQLEAEGIMIDCSLLAGIAGGAGEERIASVHIALDSIQWDLDSRPFASERGLYPGGEGKKLLSSSLQSSLKGALVEEGLDVFEGTAFTGDSFLKGERPAFVRSPGTVDMESYAFLEAASFYCQDIALLRLVSDNSKHGPGEGIKSFCRREMLRLWRAALAGTLTFTGSRDIFTQRGGE